MNPVALAPLDESFFFSPAFVLHIDGRAKFRGKGKKGCFVCCSRCFSFSFLRSFRENVPEAVTAAGFV